MSTPPLRSNEPIVLVDGCTKNYSRGSETVSVLKSVHLEIARGDFVGLIGPSGSGKTTLLNLIAGLDQPTTGRVVINGVEISSLTEAQLALWRTNAIGFVFQFFNLIPVLTAFENVELPLLLLNMSRRRRREQVLNILELVGLGHRLTHRPGQLSGGEQQRVGIARALVTDPALVVADEPTGDLDSRKSQEILDLLQELQVRLNKTILIVTHDLAVAARVRRLLRISDGQLIDDTENPESVTHPLFGSLNVSNAARVKRAEAARS
ncbi:ABC transporter ATP-binding protein [bacterium]|jgi:putative ABC transport system ATP-binding protein|nr:ABC transporter ATP-binding protein [bacterium]